MSSGINSIYSQDNINSQKVFNDGVYEFDRFRLDAAHLMLYENFSPVALAPKVVETLLALVERHGEVVSKSELMDRLWADSFVEESNLTQNIYLLRKTLGKAADGRDLIETFRRRGYRFNGQIKESSADLIETNAAGEQNAARQIARHIGDRRENAYNSLAVLPLTNESGDETIEYLSDGITESIINRLSQISQLRVVARNTVFSYKNQTIAPQEIGRKLGVSAVLTGRVLQLGERLIIRAELVETADGWQVWGEQYDRQSSDVLELQETIAREISENLQVKLTGEEKRRLTKRYTESSEAYHLYIKGRYHLNKRLTPAIERAADFFQAAIGIDPAYAPAYVGLADCYPLLSLYGALTPQEAYPKAEAAAEKALEFDDQSATAYNALGVVKLFYEWDWTGAKAAFQRAIELNSGYPDAHQRLGMFLTAMGSFDEAAAELERAIELDPLSLITKTIGGYPFYYARRYERAVERFQAVIALDENYSMAHFRLGLTFAQQGKYENATAELQKAVAISNDRDSIAALGYVQGLAGNYAPAEAALAELDEREKTGFVTSYNRVLVNVGLGDHNAALDWLEKACDERSYWLIYLKVDPALDPLRENPRFNDLLDRVYGAEESPVVAANERFSPPPTTPTGAREIKSNQAASVRFDDNRKWYYAAGVAVAVCCLLFAAGFAVKTFFAAKPLADRAVAASNLKMTRLTPDLNAYASTFTPDGKYLIYTLHEKGKHSVWLKDLTARGAAQIMPPTDTNYHHPQMSRDGETIYYITNRPNKPNGTFVRVPLAGGAEALQEIASNLISPAAISPDERQIVFVNGDDRQLRLANTDGSGERILTARDPKKGWFESWGSKMSWSPDGKQIAICGGRFGERGKPIYELILVSATDGSEQVIPTPDWNYLDDVEWLGDGTGFIVNARETEASPFQLWRVSYPEGATRRITNDTNNYDDIALSPDSRLLVSNHEFQNLNLWSAPFDDISKIKQITFGNNSADGAFGVAFAPDGKIIYTSPRGGNVDLWAMNADGDEQKQLTKDDGGWNARPQVTPDGRTIVFVSTRTGAKQIWRMDADGGNPKQLTDVFSADYPALSPDGEWIYFASHNGDKSFVAKISIDGGVPGGVSKTPDNAGSLSVSPNGKLIFYQFYEEGSPQPWRAALVLAETGERIKTFNHFFSNYGNWGADSESIVTVHGAAVHNLLQISLDEKERKQLTDFESGRIRAFAVSPDRRQSVFSRGNPSNEAVLLENF